MRKCLNLGITVFQNADFSVIISVPGPTAPINITGYTFIGQIKDSTDPLGLSLANFVFTILNQTTNTGQVKWFLGAAATLALPASISSSEQFCRQSTPYVYDILMIDTLGQKTRIIQGPCLVSPYVSS